MTIKTFDFPPFEQWNKTQEYKQKIGDYACSISIETFDVEEDPRNNFKVAIASAI